MRGALFALGLVGCNACQPAVSPDQKVYSELVSGGCLAPSDGGVAAVAAEHVLPDSPVWLSCLYDGGTVQVCDVPCQ